MLGTLGLRTPGLLSGITPEFGTPGSFKDTLGLSGLGTPGISWALQGCRQTLWCNSGLGTPGTPARALGWDLGDG